MKKTRAIVLLSGGLDSRLCAKILQEQGIEVIALHFILPFLGCCKPDCSFKFTQLEGIKLKIIDCTKGRNFQEYIQMIKNRIYLLEKFCNEYDRYAKTQFEKTYKLDKPNSSNYRLSIENFKLDLFKYQI